MEGLESLITETTILTGGGGFLIWYIKQQFNKAAKTREEVAETLKTIEDRINDLQSEKKVIQKTLEFLQKEIETKRQ